MTRRITSLLAAAFLLASPVPCLVAQDADEVKRQYDELIEQSGELLQQARYREAIPLLEKAVALTKGQSRQHPGRYAVSLGNLAAAHEGTGAYAKAVPLRLEALETWGWVLGEEDPVYATDLVSLANLYDDMGAHQKAKPLYREALETLARNPGKDHPDYANCLNSLAAHYSSIGAYEEAEPRYLEALEIQARVLGKRDPAYASTLNNLAIVYFRKSEYERAKPLFLQAAGIRWEALGEDHPDYAGSVNDLAKFYSTTGVPESAEALFLQAREIKARLLGEDHPDYATTLDNLGVFYFEWDDYEEAEPLLRQAMEIRARTLGEEHPSYCISLNNLAQFHAKLGAYEKAEPLFLQAREIEARVLGEEHPDYATTLNNLGTFYRKMGAYEKAEPLYLEARRITARALGEDCLSYASALTNLAFLYADQGLQEKGEPLLLQARDIYAQVLGKDHPEYASTLNNLAEWYRRAGRHEEAEPLYLEAKEIRARTLGEESPSYATSLNNLAGLYLNRGLYEQAEPLYLQARENYARALGEEHPDYARISSNLAFLYFAMGESDRAEILVREGLEAERRLLARVFGAFPEKDRESFLRTLKTWTMACVLENGPLAADAALAFKGAIAASVLEERRLLGSELNSEAEALLDQLQTLRHQFHRATLRGAPGREEADSLLSEIEAVEKQLTRFVSGIGAARQSLLVDTAEVQAALPPGAALVEYLRFTRPVPATLGPDWVTRWEQRYGAVVILPAAAGGEPLFFELGPAAEIDAAIERFRTLVSVQPEGEEAIVDVAQQLYRFLLAPLEPALADTTTLVLSPDSQLHFLCFEPLLDATNRMACEKWNVRMADTGRDLLEQAQANPGATSHALLIGDAAFDSPLDGQEVAGKVSSDRRDRLDVERNLALGMREDVSAVSFVPLPGTRKEVEALGSALEGAGWETRTFAGEEAREATVRDEAQDLRVVHLATHGFFLNSLRVGRNEAGRSIGIEEDEATSQAVQDPMVRSGLALAGANQTLESWQEGTVPDPSNDGILSAAEAVTLDLTGTELIVLSACETARGKALDGEGIYGLRRALKLAGSDSVVMTLWPIADAYTVGFMEDFYARYLAGQHPATALADTKREHLVELREAYGLQGAIQLAGPFIATGKGVEAIAAGVSDRADEAPER